MKRVNKSRNDQLLSLRCELKSREDLSEGPAMGGKGSASRESVSEERSERVSKELAESGVEGVSEPKMGFCLSAKLG